MHLQSTAIAIMDTSFFLLLLLTVPTGNEGSYCRSIQCTNAGSYQHGGGLGLYLRVCCNISNLGQSVTISDTGINRYILCPEVRPKSCPSGNTTNELNSLIVCYNYTDCESLFEDGYTVSGVYTVNPDGGTPFEVKLKLFIIYTLLHHRYTVTWRLMVVDGLYSRGDKMDLLISIDTGLTMRTGLAILLVSFG